jgi:hypothetical protein
MVGCGKKTVEPEQKPAVLSEENQKQQPAVLTGILHCRISRAVFESASAIVGSKC